MAETLKMRPNLLMVLGTSKREMEEADWEDVKTIWGAVGEFIGLRGSCSLYCEEVPEEDEAAWARVEEILDLADDSSDYDD